MAREKIEMECEKCKFVCYYVYADNGYATGHKEGVAQGGTSVKYDGGMATYCPEHAYILFQD